MDDVQPAECRLLHTRTDLEAKPSTDYILRTTCLLRYIRYPLAVLRSGLIEPPCSGLAWWALRPDLQTRVQKMEDALVRL